MGVGATDSDARLLAAVGDLSEAPTHFSPCDDVHCGGVLLAIPALLSCGLLTYCSRFFKLPSGYYGVRHIFMILAFMALCRIKSIEGLASCSPGEWGKLLGLDRSPATKTLRKKVALLAPQAEKWAAELSEFWMDSNPDQAGTLYVDGHTRVYHGKQTKLPRHHVARQRLCMRATTDYWVNGFDGLPFFKVNCAVDPGMIEVLEKEIVPVLEETVPNQPTQEQLDENPLVSRFRIIFDREGYSPAFFKRMQEKRIACQTYKKFVTDLWPENEFTNHEVKLISGETVEMRLAERGVLLGSKSSDQLWVREIRKLTKDGRQVSIVSTEWQATPAEIIGPQLGRWYQENFFKYGRQHFDFDRLTDYKLETVCETTKVTNPAWRKLDGAVRKLASKLYKKKAKLCDYTLGNGLNGKEIESYMENTFALGNEIEKDITRLAELKKERKEHSRKIEIQDLPEKDQFMKLSHRTKHFSDTLKIIAYRAETAMSETIRNDLGKHHRDESRRFIRTLYTTDANIRPDPNEKKLIVELHSLATPKDNRIAAKLCEKLNETEIVYPGTDLVLFYKMVSP